jgi:hypothetical protein
VGPRTPRTPDTPRHLRSLSSLKLRCKAGSDAPKPKAVCEFSGFRNVILARSAVRGAIDVSQSTSTASVQVRVGGCSRFPLYAVRRLHMPGLRLRLACATRLGNGGADRSCLARISTSSHQAAPVAPFRRGCCSASV